MTGRDRDGLTHVRDLLAGLDIPEPSQEAALTPAPLMRPKTSRERRKRAVREHIQVTRYEGEQELAYLAKPFLLCGLPFQKPKGPGHVYERRNGDEFLKIIGSPEHGLPFGADILVLIWVSTLAVLNMRDGKVPRVIEFPRARDMLKAFGLPLDGPSYRRMQARFLRVFYATFYYGQQDGRGRAKLYAMRFFDSMDLWFTRDLDTGPPLGEDFKNNRVVLSEAFAAELERVRPPVLLDMVRHFTDQPGPLFFGLWLTWRCANAKGGEEIPLMGPEGVKAQCGVQGYDDPEQGARSFRNKLRGWLVKILDAWEDCPARLKTTERGDILVIERMASPVRPRSKTVSKR